MSKWVDVFGARPQQHRRRTARVLLRAALAAGVAGVALAAATWPQAAPAQQARAAEAGGARFGFGRAPTAEEIEAWDIDVRPDGHGVRRGRGSVRDGQAIYDAKCAACHGTFGESTAYMIIAGGVEKGDLKAGRASGLLRGEVRTVGTKLNHASTLWDYIYRAMPWAQPQSLSVDETYAVTAYVLHLNEIVDEDFVLDEKNLLTLPMPNRNGLTTNHGMRSVTGKPDVQGSLCMRDCGAAPKIVSEMPAYARNAHGNLAQQQRPRGAVRGADTARYDAGKPMLAAAGGLTDAAPATGSGAGAATAASASTGARSENHAGARELLGRHACTTCHGVEQRIVGPGFVEVGGRYRDRADAAAYLAARIRNGGTGAWGQVPMPAQPGVAEADAAAIAQWILAGAR
jgi:cytochrome c